MSHRMRSSRRRPLSLAGVLIATLLALLLAACGRTIDDHPIALATLSARSQPIPTAAPTYTAAPAHPLIWQARPLPAPITDAIPGYSALSLSNMGTSWICAAHGAGVEVWVSHDSAQHWQRVSDVAAGGPVDTCSVIADEVDPAIAVVQAARRQPGCCALPAIPYPLMATHDGGKTWTRSNGPLSEMSQLASYRGVSYAVFHAPIVDASPGVFAFAASTDRLRTWHRIDGALASSGSDPVDARAVRDLWLNPATGELLVHTQTSAIWTDHFLTSSDGGATWQDLHAPLADQFLVRAPYAAGSWEICGLRTSTSSGHPDWPAPTICTLDSGKSWKSRDAFAGQDDYAFALANDGALLAGVTPGGMYRSPPGKSAWDALGAPPASGAFWYEYQPGAGSGLIWALPETSATNAPPATLMYLARYA